MMGALIVNIIILENHDIRNAQNFTLLLMVAVLAVTLKGRCSMGIKNCTDCKWSSVSNETHSHCSKMGMKNNNDAVNCNVFKRKELEIDPVEEKVIKVESDRFEYIFGQYGKLVFHKNYSENLVEINHTEFLQYDAEYNFTVGLFSGSSKESIPATVRQFAVWLNGIADEIEKLDKKQAEV